MKYIKTAEILLAKLNSKITKCPKCEALLLDEKCITKKCEAFNTNTRLYLIAAIIELNADEAAKVHKQRHEDYLKRYQDDGR